MSSFHGLTVGELVNRLFPAGTQSFEFDDSKDGPHNETWPRPPDFPPDMFAVAAHLLETAGAYSYLMGSDPGTSPPQNDGLSIDETAFSAAAQAGAEWRLAYSVPPLVVELWRELGLHADTPLYIRHKPKSSQQTWWSVALRLLIAADEACADAGYGGTRQFEENQRSWVVELIELGPDRLLERLTEKDKEENGTGHIKFFPHDDSICVMADPDVVCVQPKSRTPVVGCALRAFSHNLALLPPRGVVRTNWQRSSSILPKEDGSVLNLLLVPYPFEISASWFEADLKLSPEHAVGKHGSTPWGWFELHQRWLTGPPDSNERTLRQGHLITFVEALITRARADLGTVHGLVFPEYALDWETYEKLVSAIQKSAPDMQFMVAGSSGNCAGEVGNFALSTVFSKEDSADGSTAITMSRAKHHRWRLDSSQISTYALASALDPRVTWWEKIVLPKREIHINVFRDSSTFATMICEDLARADPCHVVLRSAAPSLVFVLLMDGPQLAERWAARYATVLAEDPGSSVLTITSMGLLERANRTGRPTMNRSIALWKDDTGMAMSIPFEADAHGVALTLSGYRTSEVTVDGRPNLDGRAWRFHGHQPVRLRKDDIDEATLLSVLGRH